MIEKLIRDLDDALIRIRLHTGGVLKIKRIIKELEKVKCFNCERLNECIINARFCSNFEMRKDLRESNSTYKTFIH